MKRAFVSSIFLFIFSIAILAQTNENMPCPTLSVTGPAGMILVGEPITFTANLDKQDESFMYSWSVSDGTIIEGLGTPVIKVMTTPEEAEKEITVTVELKNLPSNCANKASLKAFITRGNADPVAADEYGKLSDKDEKARLENIAVQLKQNKDLRAYFLVYLPKKNLNETAKKRVSKIKNYLVKDQKISDDRIIIFTNEADVMQTQIYLAPAGAILPNPN